MTNLITIMLFLLTIAGSVETDCITGTLSQYAARPTRETLYNRSIPGKTAYTLPVDRTGIDGYVALLECDGEMGKVGDAVTVHWQEHTVRLMIFDCSGNARTTKWMVRNNIIGEVSHNIARDWGVIGRGMRGAVMCRSE